MCADLYSATARQLSSKGLACRYYRDRLSTPRGPCNIWVLRDCWASGVIDENTLMWGQGLATGCRPRTSTCSSRKYATLRVRALVMHGESASLLAC